MMEAYKLTLHREDKARELNYGSFIFYGRR